MPRLLLVEDSPGDTRLLREALADGQCPGQFSVTTAGTLADGLAQLASGSFDALLLDLGLPDSLGLPTLAAVLATDPQCPVLVVSGCADADLARAAVSAGAQDYLEKSYLSPYWLGRTITHAIERFRLVARVHAAEAGEAAAARAASAAKSAFVAYMAHELRAPVSAILAACGPLRSGDAPPGVDPVSIIQRTARHLLDLVNVTLDLGKIEAGHLEVARQRVDLGEVVEEAIDLVKLAAMAKGISLRVTGDVKAVTADHVRCRQIICNLLSNAIKFSGPDTAIDLCFGEAGGACELLVTDNGCGIAPATAERIFQPYDQGGGGTAARFGGTGLGLALSRGLARAMGGDLLVHASAPGQGARFALRLPLVGGTAAPVRHAEEPARLAAAPACHAAALPHLTSAPACHAAAPVRPQALVGLRALVADDDEAMRQLTALLLRRAGATVVEVGDGVATLGAAQSASFDACVLDLNMPGTDEASLPRQLRELGVTGPIVAFSACADGAAQRQCLVSGFDAFVPKHAAGKILVARLAELCGRAP